jgi:peroxiredoxin Q/BCP
MIMVEIGDKVENFCLPNQDEEEICWRDIKGRWVILYFYPKDNTPGCTTEACEFTEALPNFESLDAIVLGVSPDSPLKHRNFIAKKELKLTLLADEDKELSKAFGVWKLKKNFGKEYMGIVRSTFIINPDGVIAHRWKSVKVKEHVRIVEEKLKKLQES